MNTLVFASSNPHKVEEIAAILGGSLHLLGLQDVGITHDLAEDAQTLEGNARQKARQVWEITGKDCFADDTGLEVDALGGAPGVYSARYAGAQRDASANRTFLLQELRGASDRTARFRTVICLILRDREYLFEGVVDGTIAEAGRGEGGFGYDALFIPQGHTRTFAEMDPAEKNALSHRGRAAEKLAAFLQANPTS
ncbi:MAG: RdgB/HAM1 family non-canonical purine NTP pyrophosphatase [Flavobacteriales bacterium]|jgi:XTP/dITP diphosphohydrolase